MTSLGKVASFALPLAADIGSSVFNVKSQLRENERNRAFAQGESLKAYQRNVEQWQRQADYNTPQNQMARLREAGLSPHLVYGTGNIANTGPTELAKYTPAHYQGTAPRISENTGNNILAYQMQGRNLLGKDIENQGARMKNLQTALFNEKEQLDLTSKGGARIVVGKKGHIKAILIDSDYGKKQPNYYEAMAKLNLKLKKLEVNMNTVLQQTADKIKDLRKLGVNPSDDTDVLSTVELLREYGLNDNQIRSALIGYKVGGKTIDALLKAYGIRSAANAIGNKKAPKKKVINKNRTVIHNKSDKY